MSPEERDAIDAALNVPALVLATREGIVAAIHRCGLLPDIERSVDAALVRCIERARGLP